MSKHKSLIFITTITSFFVATCAAIFSVTGIAKLFAGAALSAAIMASSLELGKIVSISFLYQYWENIPRTLKIYLSTAAVILMVITSAGIYGYLSAAYAKVAATPIQTSAEIKSLSARIQSIDDDIQRKNTRLQQIIDLRQQQETRLDALISKSQTGSSGTIRTAQTGLANADRNITQIQTELTSLANTKDSLTAISINKQVSIDTNSDIGTFLYIAKMLNTSLDSVVKWFTFIIVLVFDPLAIALVIAVNFLIKNTPVQLPVEPVEAVKIVSAPLMEKSTIEEPYQVFMPTPSSNESIEEIPKNIVEEPQPPVDTYERRDLQYYRRGDFDWNNRLMWEHDPNAVEYYNTVIRPS